MRTAHLLPIVLYIALFTPCQQGFAQNNATTSPVGIAPQSTINGGLTLSAVSGSDICVRLKNALALLPAQGGIINAMSFTGEQSCSVNPFSDLHSFSNSFHPWIRLGNVDIQTSVPWVALSNIVLTGSNSSANHTQIDYVGSKIVPAVMTLGQFETLDNAHSIFGAKVSNILFTSSRGTAEDGLLIESTHHSEFNNISAWGITNCGIETKFAVTDTFLRPKVSALDASHAGYRSPRTPPMHDFCFGGRGGYQTTDGTVLDPAAEGSTVSGIWMPQAASMTFLSGTAEGNNHVGVEISGASSDNTFIGTDLEDNLGGDILDGGSSTQWINIIAADRITFTHSCSGAMLIGGNHKRPVSESLNCPEQVDGSLYQNPNPRIQRVVNQRIKAFAGNSQPPVGNALGSLTFNSSPTIIYPFPMLPGKPWRLIMLGVWNNTANSPKTPMPALYTEISSDHPTLAVGSLSVTFSLNQASQIQGTCISCSSGNKIFFSGTVIPVGAGYMTDVSRSIRVQGSIDGASYKVHGSPLASKDLSDSGTLMRFVGAITTTAAPSNSLTAPGIPAGAACFATAQNSTASSLTSLYVPPTANAGVVTIFHNPTPGAIFSVFCQ